MLARARERTDRLGGGLGYMDQTHHCCWTIPTFLRDAPMFVLTKVDSLSWTWSRTDYLERLLYFHLSLFFFSCHCEGSLTDLQLGGVCLPPQSKTLDKTLSGHFYLVQIWHLGAVWCLESNFRCDILPSWMISDAESDTKKCAKLC